MLKVIPYSVLHVIYLYLMYFNMTYFSACSYKDSIGNLKIKSLNGFLLGFFVWLSGLGDLLYKLVRKLGYMVAGFLPVKIEIREKLAISLDMIFFGLTSFGLTAVYGSFIEKCELWQELAETWAESLSGYAAGIAASFLFYCIIYGFFGTGSRIASTSLSRFFQKGKDACAERAEEEEIETGIGIALIKDVVIQEYQNQVLSQNGGEKSKYSRYIKNGAYKSMEVLLGRLEEFTHLFVGLKKIIPAVMAGFICTAACAVLAGLGRLELSVDAFWSDLLPLGEILELLKAMIFTILTVFGVKTLFELLLKYASPKSFSNKIFEGAAAMGHKAADKLEERREKALTSDKIIRSVEYQESMYTKSDSDMYQSVEPALLLDMVMEINCPNVSYDPQSMQISFTSQELKKVYPLCRAVRMKNQVALQWSARSELLKMYEQEVFHREQNNKKGLTHYFDAAGGPTAGNINIQPQTEEKGPERFTKDQIQAVQRFLENRVQECLDMEAQLNRK